MDLFHLEYDWWIGVVANLRGIVAWYFETVFLFFYDTVVVRNLTNSPVNITPQYAFSHAKIKKQYNM